MNPIARKLAFLKDSLAKYGLAVTLCDLGTRALNSVSAFQVQRGMTVVLDDVTDPRQFEAPGFSTRFLSPEEMWALAVDPAHQLPGDFVRQAIERGDHCHAFFDEQGALAAYGWYSNQRTPLDEHFELRFDPGWTYMYKGFVLPAYRGQRLHAVGMCQALREFTAQGKKGLISCVLANNGASLKSVARMGYRIFGDVYLLRVMGRSFSWATPGCRAYGFAIEPIEDLRAASAAGSFRKL